MSSRFSDEEAGGILARSGFRKPLRVAQSLRVMRGLSGCRRESPEFAENLVREALRAADPDAVILHLATLIESASSPGAILDLLSQKPHALRTLCGVLGASTYLAQLLLRSPGYVDLIWNVRPFTPDQVRDLDYIRRRKERELGKEKDGVDYDFKVGRGGLMDIQFVVKYLQLQHGIEGRGTRCGISKLVEAGHLDPDEGSVLSRGAGFLFRLEALQRLLAESSATRLPRDPARCAVTARLMGLDSGGSLLERYRFETAAIRQIYLNFFSC